MSKVLLGSVFLVLFGTVVSTGASHIVRAQDTPTCGFCMILISYLQVYCEANGYTPEEGFPALCDDLFAEGTVYHVACIGFADILGPVLYPVMGNYTYSDDMCVALGVCNGNCPVYSDTVQASATQQAPEIEEAIRSVTAAVQSILAPSPRDSGFLYPLEDIDGDWFSEAYELRGWSFRGKDCSDLEAGRHPGVTETGAIDTNCNGISGMYSALKSYEEEWCAPYPGLGVAVLGASEASHFTVPWDLVHPELVNPSVQPLITEMLYNVGDWPQYSMWTGFEIPDAQYDINFTTPSSIYWYMRNRNRCNFRDYQNIGINGANVGDLASSYAVSLARNTTERPLLVFLSAEFGDICAEDPVDPTVFKENTLTILDGLSSKLPSGSHVVLMGLENSTMYDIGKDGTQPIMRISYEDWWNMEICTGVLYCTLVDPNRRDWADEQVETLNAVYQDVAATANYDNFDVMFLDYNVYKLQAIQEVIDQGYDPIIMFEPWDSFHPSSVAHQLIPSKIWNELVNNYPDILGKENPNNDAIIRQFGDQQIDG